MAILDVNKYYYFRLRDGQPYSIKESLLPINTTIMHNYQELTEDQRSFYLANPTASIQEVVNCALTTPYVPPEQDVQEYIEYKIKELKELCYNSITITSLEYAIAEDKINNIISDNYYSLTEANKIISSFRTQAKTALTVFNNYSTQIKEATSNKIVDNLFNEAIALL